MKRLTPALCRRTVEDFNARTRFPRGIRMRAATIKDLDAIMAVGLACFAYDAPERHKIRHFLTRAHAAIIALCDGDDVIGYLHIEAHAGRRTLYINTIALLPDWRGKGLGKAFFKVSDALALAVNAASLWCHVALGNVSTSALFRKNGYVVARVIDPYYEEAYDDGGRGAYVLRKVTGMRS